MNGYTPAIISEALFQKVQARLAAEPRFRGDKARPHFLTGFVKCQVCRTSMTVHEGIGKRSYYRCSGALQSEVCGSADQEDCRVRAINAARLENWVWSHVTATVRGQNGVIVDLERDLRVRGLEIEQEFGRLLGEIRKLKQEVVCLEKEDMKRLPALLAGLWARFVVLEEQRAMVETSVTACERVREYCLGVSEQLAEMDDACKRDLMARLRMKVLVVGAEVEITAEIDLDLW